MIAGKSCCQLVAHAKNVITVQVKLCLQIICIIMGNLNHPNSHLLSVKINVDSTHVMF